MKFSSDASVLRLTHEDVTNFESLPDFDKKNIENFPSNCKNIISTIEANDSNSIAAKASVDGARISSKSVRRLITAVNAEKRHGSIPRATDPQNVDCASVLATFKINQEACLCIKDHDESKVPKMNDKGNNRNVVRWSLIIKEYL